MTYRRDIAASLGKKLWTTDFFIPRYRSGEVGPWKIDPGGQLITDWGYYTEPCLVEMGPSFACRLKPDDNAVGNRWETWMSLTPHEIESQELGCRHAFKHTAIMGLGMGWIAANVALSPVVTKVTVVERDPDVISIFEQSGALDSLPGPARNKLSIIHANAMDWHPTSTEVVNFLFADIWLQLADPAALGQVRQMQAHIQAEKIYYWGQEIAIHCAAKRYIEKSTITPAEAIQLGVDELIQLPLLVPDDSDYPQMIEKVIQNRITRKLPIDVDVS